MHYIEIIYYIQLHAIIYVSNYILNITFAASVLKTHV